MRDARFDSSANRGGRLNIRVAAIIRDQDKILVSKWPDGTISLVGGRVAYGETTQAAISREVTEETGLAVKSAQLHAIIENFFTHRDHFFHEFLYVYDVETSSFELNQTAQDFEDQEILWLSTSEYASLRPKVLSDVIKYKSGRILHLVNQEAKLVR